MTQLSINGYRIPPPGFSGCDFLDRKQWELKCFYTKTPPAGIFRQAVSFCFSYLPNFLFSNRHLRKAVFLDFRQLKVLFFSPLLAPLLYTDTTAFPERFCQPVHAVDLHLYEGRHFLKVKLSGIRFHSGKKTPHVIFGTVGIIPAFAKRCQR